MNTKRWLMIFSLILTLAVNFLANALPLNGVMTGEISDRFPILFVPAGYVFSIWGLIYLALVAFTIHSRHTRGFLRYVRLFRGRGDQVRGLKPGIQHIVRCCNNDGGNRAASKDTITSQVLILLTIGLFLSVYSNYWIRVPLHKGGVCSLWVGVSDGGEGGWCDPREREVVSGGIFGHNLAGLVIQ